MMRWAGLVAHVEGNRYANRVLMEKYKGKRPLERSRHLWEVNIKTALKERG
jgi:hypothetical protein